MRFLVFLLCLVCSALDAQNFDGMDAALARGDFGRVKAVIVSRNGQTLFENYYRGSRADDLHMIQSVTKTVGSTLVGIAHRNGLIRLDQDLEHFFGGLYDMSQGALADKRAIAKYPLVRRLPFITPPAGKNFRPASHTSYQSSTNQFWSATLK